MMVPSCNCSSLALGERTYTSSYLASGTDPEALFLQGLQASNGEDLPPVGGDKVWPCCQTTLKTNQSEEINKNKVQKSEASEIASLEVTLLF